MQNSIIPYHLIRYNKPMRRYVHSVGYALSGITYAFRTERNFRLFLFGYTASLFLPLILGLGRTEFPVVIAAGGFFLAIELLNTALERFADAFDSHTKKQDDVHFQAIKCTKDIAAGASLVCAYVWAITLLFIFIPRIAELIVESRI